MAETVPVTTADGIELAAEVHGEDVPGRPSLLLIPGLGATRRIMDPLIPYLTPFRRVVVYDQRGVGASQMTDPPWTLRLLGDDAAAVATTLATPPCDVLGASMGGMVAQHLAADHPEIVRRLVLAATTPGGDRAIARNRYVRERLLGRGARTPAEAYRLASTVLYSDRFLHAHPDFIEAQVAERAAHPVRARTFSAQNAAASDHDMWERLPGFRMPVLVLHGTDDMLMPVGNAERLAARIPASRHYWFPGGGHLFFHEDPRRTAEVIRQFLDS